MGLLEQAANSRLVGHPVEFLHELLVELRIGSEVVRTEDHVDEIVVDRVFDALLQLATVSGHSRKADLSLLLGEVHELEPLGILHAVEIVDRVIEEDVDVVGAQALQALFEFGHDQLSIVRRFREVLGGDDHLVALVVERLAEEILDEPPFTPTLDAVHLGGIEVGHAAVITVANDVGARAATRSETDVRDDEPGLAERHVFLDGC